MANGTLLPGLKRAGLRRLILDRRSFLVLLLCVALEGLLGRRGLLRTRGARPAQGRDSLLESHKDV